MEYLLTQLSPRITDGILTVVAASRGRDTKRVALAENTHRRKYRQDGKAIGKMSQA